MSIKHNDKCIISLFRTSIFQLPIEYIFETREEYIFIRDYERAHNKSLEYATNETRSKVIAGEAYLMAIIWIRLGDNHKLILLLYNSSPKELFLFWLKLLATNLEGELIIDPNIPSKRVGQVISRIGKLVGPIVYNHKMIWSETNKTTDYKYEPLVIGPDSGLLPSIKLKGLKVQLKFLGPVDPFAEFVI